MRKQAAYDFQRLFMNPRIVKKTMPFTNPKPQSISRPEQNYRNQPIDENCRIGLPIDQQSQQANSFFSQLHKKFKVVQMPAIQNGLSKNVKRNIFGDLMPNGSQMLNDRPLMTSISREHSLASERSQRSQATHTHQRFKMQMSTNQLQSNLRKSSEKLQRLREKLSEMSRLKTEASQKCLHQQSIQNKKYQSIILR